MEPPTYPERYLRLQRGLASGELQGVKVGLYLLYRFVELLAEGYLVELLYVEKV